jgi:hypothetical protein
MSRPTSPPSILGVSLLSVISLLQLPTPPAPPLLSPAPSHPGHSSPQRRGAAGANMRLWYAVRKEQAPPSTGSSDVAWICSGEARRLRATALPPRKDAEAEQRPVRILRREPRPDLLRRGGKPPSHRPSPRNDAEAEQWPAWRRSRGAFLHCAEVERVPSCLAGAPP